MQVTSKRIEPNSQRYFLNAAAHWRPENTFVMKPDFAVVVRNFHFSD
jgi:hypothetical protein